MGDGAEACRGLASCGKTIFHVENLTACMSRTEDGIIVGCSKSPSCKAAGESKPEAYPQGYVEDFDETRTMQAGFFSIRLG